MKSAPIGRYHQMPKLVLEEAVLDRAELIKSDNLDEFSLRDVGYFLRIYRGMLGYIGKVTGNSKDDRILNPFARFNLTHIVNCCTEVQQNLLVDMGARPLQLPTAKLNYGEIIEQTGQRLEAVVHLSHKERKARELVQLLNLLEGDSASSADLKNARHPTVFTAIPAFELLEAGAEGFRNVFFECELVFASASVGVRDDLVTEIATIVGSEWQHPEWVPPMQTN